MTQSLACPVDAGAIRLYAEPGRAMGWTPRVGKVDLERLVRGDETFRVAARHASRCDPLMDAMRTSVELVLDQDLVVEWKGGGGTLDIEVVEPLGIFKSAFGLGTVTCDRSCIWRAPEGYDLLIGPVPHQEQRDWACMDAVVPGDLDYPWFPTIQFFRPGRHVIPAGTAIASVRLVAAGPVGFEFTDEPPETREAKLLHGSQRANGGTMMYRRSRKRLASV